MKCLYFATPARGEGRVIAQSESGRRVAHIVLQLQNSPESGRGMLLLEVDDAVVPAQFRGAVTNGVRLLFENRFCDWLPQGLVVRVVGGACHATDSQALDFRDATVAAFLDAVGEIEGRSAEN